MPLRGRRVGQACGALMPASCPVRGRPCRGSVGRHHLVTPSFLPRGSLRFGVCVKARRRHGSAFSVTAPEKTDAARDGSALRQTIRDRPVRKWKRGTTGIAAMAVGAPEHSSGAGADPQKTHLTAWHYTPAPFGASPLTDRPHGRRRPFRDHFWIRARPRETKRKVAQTWRVFAGAPLVLGGPSRFRGLFEGRVVSRSEKPETSADMREYSGFWPETRGFLAFSCRKCAVRPGRARAAVASSFPELHHNNAAKRHLRRGKKAKTWRSAQVEKVTSKLPNGGDCCQIMTETAARTPASDSFRTYRRFDSANAAEQAQGRCCCTAAARRPGWGLRGAPSARTIRPTRGDCGESGNSGGGSGPRRPRNPDGRRPAWSAVSV